MSLTRFMQGVGVELQELLWRDVPQTAMLDELDGVETQLLEESEVLAQRQSSLGKLQSGLKEKEHRARWLEDRVQIYLHVGDQANAWSHALELDRLRDAIEIKRTEVQHQREAYHRQLARVRHLRQRLADLQEQMYSNG